VFWRQCSADLCARASMRFSTLLSRFRARKVQVQRSAEHANTFPADSCGLLAGDDQRSSAITFCARRASTSLNELGKMEFAARRRERANENSLLLLIFRLVCAITGNDTKEYKIACQIKGAKYHRAAAPAAASSCYPSF